MEKGGNLAMVLDRAAVECMAHNLGLAWRKFDRNGFVVRALDGLEPLTLMARADHIAAAMREHLPERFDKACSILVASLGEARTATSGGGLEVFFYLPHGRFVANYGIDPAGNGGDDPFESAMSAQYAITKRFTAEFSMRPFLDVHLNRTIRRLLKWTTDPDPHVRRLCSEGSRPRLPWAQRVPALVRDPRPILPILEALKDDPELYVRRSVANSVGDIAKDHLELALGLCRRWLKGASSERLWVVRHALRYPAKKGNAEALELRRMAGGRG